MLHVTVERGRCQGAGECVYLAPASFYIDDTVTAAVHEPPGDPDAALLEAACSCPNSAIRVFRDGEEIDAFGAFERSVNE